MSFILDALRKSETERQRQSGPGLVDAGYRPPARRRGFWLPLLVCVLVANLLLLGLVWIRSAPAPTSPAVATVPAPVTAPIAPPVPAAPPDADYEAMADVPALEPEDPSPAEMPEPLDTVAEPYGYETQPVDQGVAGRGTVVDDLPTAGQLMASGALTTRPMHLDIHVFSTTPAERFVFINMRKYAEGAQLDEGPRIEEITPEGVVLNEGGQRFLLTRE